MAIMSLNVSRLQVIVSWQLMGLWGVTQLSGV